MLGGVVGALHLKPPLKPPLKWAGGKRWLVPHMWPLWEGHEAKRFVEPFAGGLAVALALRPERAQLNDANPHLINFLDWLKRGLVIEMPMENERELFYAHRQRFNDLVSTGCETSHEAASLFYYLNRTCFNGLCRFNRKGGFNVPFGRSNRSPTRGRSSRMSMRWQRGRCDRGISRPSNWNRTTLCMRIRLMTWNSLSIRRRAFAGRTRCGLPNGLRRTLVPSCFRTRRRGACSLSMPSTGST